MTPFIALLLILIAAAGTVTVLIREPVRQAIMAGLLALLLTLLFFALQAPDVAFSELVIGTAGVPAMLLLAIAKIRGQQAEMRRDDGSADGGGGDP